ncbi:hypothetical protein L3Q65_00245 (plasmid) [Amycolatopsis sp. FU40]|uniref:hypothetical protein n=1 Tax=Amycolatopsis sp. FU40 TaxID=2914159 RepID=UPI001F33DE8F|nr:hypothetical protein [Amycolatopsis sp. FU40]UKD50729.1 hypothetical protein L3Q65_00245 [Amycolatopsis sp. FU40]
MNTLWALILFATVGAIFCCKARAAGPAVLFALAALGMFVFTGTGQEVLEHVAHLRISAAGAR